MCIGICLLQSSRTLEGKYLIKYAYNEGFGENNSDEIVSKYLKYRWGNRDGCPSKIASVETKKTALRLHHLDKSEHFVRAFIGITLVCIGHLVVGCEILTPKLIDLKTALVDVEMDIALFKIGSAGFPYLGFGVQSLNRLPRTVADTFAVRFGQYKENI